MTGIDLLLHPESNVHFHEIAEVLARALGDLGCDVELVDDGRLPQDDRRAILAVGPHEIYPRFYDLDREWLEHSLHRTIAVGTEQPGLPWFDIALPYQAAAAFALDISRFGVDQQRRRGVGAEHLQLGYHPSLDASGDVRDRELDVLFMGNVTDRRATFLGHCAPVIASWKADLRVTHVDVDQRDRFSGFIAGDAKRRLLASSRLLVNIHRADATYFEWVRALDALSNGTLLVTEHSVDYEPLVAGEHFLSVRAEDLPWTLETALRDTSWADRIRLAGQRFVREQLPLTKTISQLAEMAGTAVQAGLRPNGPPPPLPLPPATPPPPRRPPPAAPIDMENWRERAALKRLSLDVLGLRRTIASMALAPDTPLVEEWCSASWGDQVPEVSVVVTLYNYARFVGEAIDSIARSVGVSYEIIVVDDASSDRSNDVVRAWIERRPELPILLLRHRINRGLPVSRNLGFSRANAPLVFVLDADNLVYPEGMALLRDALDDDPEAAFAYGFLHRFDDAGGAGVSGALPWQPAQLAKENYIDAMALVRHAVWTQLGGYATDAALHGWEDYDFWLGCASAGRHGAHVRQFVAKYRSHPTSMLSLTDLETESTRALLRQRHANLYRSLEPTE